MPIIRLDPVGPRRATLVALPGLGHNAYSFLPSSFAPVRQLGVSVVFMEYASHVDTVQDMAAYVWRCLDNMGATTGPVLLLGYSMGGFVLQAMYKQRPGSVWGIVFLSTTCPIPEDVFTPFLSKANMVTSAKLCMGNRRQRRGRAKTIMARHAAGTLDVPVQEYMHALHHSDIPYNLYVKEVGAVMAYSLSGASVAIIRRVTCPVLLMYGSLDDVIPVESIRRLRQAAAFASTFTEVEIYGTGHGAMYDAADVFRASLVKWVRELECI